MSRPPINPDKTTAGIIVDPQTLERVIPESRRPDGSVRKQIKVRPGFTPQEDVKRFRGTRQTQMDVSAIPKGHIIGWVPPSSATQPVKPMSKSAKKNAKRKEKREEKKVPEPVDKPVRDNWEDDDDDDGAGGGDSSGEDTAPKVSISTSTPANATKIESPPAEHTADKPNETAVVSPKAIQKLTADLKKLSTK